MNKKIKVGTVIAALLAVTPVVGSVVTDTTTTTNVVQAAKKSKKVKKTKKIKKTSKKSKKTSKKISGYTKKDYLTADAIIPKKDIKLYNDDNKGKYYQTLKKGVMYEVPVYSIEGTPKIYDKKHYTLWMFKDDEEYYSEVKISDVIPFKYSKDKSIKKYVKAYNNFEKNLKSNQSMGFKIKKDTTAFVVPPYVQSIPGKENVLKEFGYVDSKAKKTVLKKNDVFYVDDSQISKEDLIKYKGKYYYGVDIPIKKYMNDPYANPYVFVPVDSVEFTALEGSKDVLKSNYSI